MTKTPTTDEPISIPELKAALRRMKRRARVVRRGRSVMVYLFAPVGA